MRLVLATLILLAGCTAVVPGNSSDAQPTSSSSSSNPIKSADASPSATPLGTKAAPKSAASEAKREEPADRMTLGSPWRLEPTTSGVKDVWAGRPILGVRDDRLSLYAINIDDKQRVCDIEAPACFLALHLAPVPITGKVEPFELVDAGGARLMHTANHELRKPPSVSKPVHVRGTNGFMVEYFDIEGSAKPKEPWQYQSNRDMRLVRWTQVSGDWTIYFEWISNRRLESASETIARVNALIEIA